MSFRLVLKSVTLNDLERRNGVILRYFSEFGYLPGALCKSSRSLSHLLMSSCCLYQRHVPRCQLSRELNTLRRQKLHCNYSGFYGSIKFVAVVVVIIFCKYIFGEILCINVKCTNARCVRKLKI